MSLAWFWVESLKQSGRIVLSPEESRHVVSRRLRKGDEVVVFDGAGQRANARIDGLAKKAVELTVEEIEVVPQPVDRFVLATGIPKGDRLGMLLQMGTQLGLTTWQPLVLENSAVRKLDPDAARLRRILIEACKVARRPWAMQIRPPISLEAALGEAARAEEGAAALFFGDAEGSSQRPTLSREGAAAMAFIGPEAGFSEGERKSLLSAGAAALSFSEYNLRIETAAVAAIVAFSGEA